MTNHKEQPVMTMKALKIAYLGGGSRGWARKLMMDLALCPDLNGEIALYDIDSASATLNASLGNWMQTLPGAVSNWRYHVAATLNEALGGADFVIISIQPGSLQMMAEEISIAEEYGLFYPVGDTTGVTGLNRGLRSAAIYNHFARAIEACCPNAWVINYTNPMSLCTRTLASVFPKIKVFGCCHEVFATQKKLAKLAAQHFSLNQVPERHEIKVNVLGINHFTWVDKASYQGEDLFQVIDRHIKDPETLRPYARKEVEAFNDWFYSTDRVKFSLYQIYGILAAAGDRHLVEFLPGFIHSPENLFNWGVIRTPVSYRIQRWQVSPQEINDWLSGKVPLALQASDEEGVRQIKALLGMGDLVTNVNLPNTGQMPGLPEGAIVETNAIFSCDRVTPLCAGKLPPAIHSLVSAHVQNQELIIQAVLEGRVELAFQAFYNDPTHHLDVGKMRQLFNRLMIVNQPILQHWEMQPS